MSTFRFSVVIFYDEQGRVLLQDRRNLGKDDTEWGWFGGGAEGDETPIDTAIREIKEEINIDIVPSDLVYIGRVTRETIFLDDIRDGSIFCMLWKHEYNKDFMVLEGAGYDWVTPDEMRERRIYETQRVHLSIFETYLRTKNA